MKKINSKILLVVVVFGLVSALIYWAYWKNIPPIFRGKAKNLAPFPLTESQMKEELKEYESLMPLLKAQARHETGDFTSSLYSRANNMFGMKIPTKRNYVRKGTTAGYSAYTSPKQSLQDMVLLLRHNRFPTDIASVEDYVAQLKADKFFTDDPQNYLRGMKRFL